MPETEPVFAPGDHIMSGDGLVCGLVISRGRLKFGREWLPVYRVWYTTGHEYGRLGLILEANAQSVSRAKKEKKTA